MEVSSSSCELAFDSANPNLQKLKHEIIGYQCIFCNDSIVDEIRLGPLYILDGCVVHYYCMLFSSALCQRGNDEDGILGFLNADLMKEKSRVSRIKCYYCNNPGANVGCCSKRCRLVYHFPCGLKNGTNFQFHGKYESFCSDHTKPLPISCNFNDVENCVICMLPLGEEQVVKANCCKGAIFHKICIQRMAMSAGYFFKCPMCNNTKKFSFQMRNSGIHVPEQDASWEKDNAYQDLYERYSHCDAEKCYCKNMSGRSFYAEKGDWSLARCLLCGASAVHKKCGKLQSTNDWTCIGCIEIELKRKENLNGDDSETVAPPAKRQRPSESVVDESLPGPSQASTNSEQNNRKKSKKVNGTETKRGRPFQTQHRVVPPNPHLSQVIVVSSCFSYFPYSRNALKKLKSSRSTIPDWRGLELTVNLTQWIPDLVYEDQCTYRPETMTIIKQKPSENIVESAEPIEMDTIEDVKGHKLRKRRPQHYGEEEDDEMDSEERKIANCIARSKRASRRSTLKDLTDRMCKKFSSRNVSYSLSSTELLQTDENESSIADDQNLMDGDSYIKEVKSDEHDDDFAKESVVELSSVEQNRSFSTQSSEINEPYMSKEIGEEVFLLESSVGMKRGRKRFWSQPDGAKPPEQSPSLSPLNLEIKGPLPEKENYFCEFVFESQVEDEMGSDEIVQEVEYIEPRVELVPTTKEALLFQAESARCRTELSQNDKKNSVSPLQDIFNRRKKEMKTDSSINKQLFVIDVIDDD